MSTSEYGRVNIQRAVAILLRDGVELNATVYTPANGRAPRPSIVALTPYVADHLHDRGMYFAARGYAFVAVDVRGRGDSAGTFRPMIQEARDGYDVVEWIAQQAFCNGKVAMYGGSYLGYAQWVTAKECPPHLVTIVPVASPFMGVDVPMRNNIFTTYEVRWQVAVSGRTSQMKVFSDNALWARMCRKWYESGQSFRSADTEMGHPSVFFQEYLAHAEPGAYWDSYNPTQKDYRHMAIPVLTITGVYDGDQLGALEHYRQHTGLAVSSARAKHYLVIGPWNHAGCAWPCAEFDGLKVGAESLINMLELHTAWYEWTMQDGPKPSFLKDNVAYYVMVADRWHYVNTLEQATTRFDFLYLQSTCNPTDVFKSGSLVATPATDSSPDHYIYDPRDISRAELESAGEWMGNWADQRLLFAAQGKLLAYHSEPLEEDTEITGCFRLVAWLSIDQPDTDIRAWIYDVDGNGGSVLMTMDSMRARYRESNREAKLIGTPAPLRYHFQSFTFVSRLVRKGNRLRLVLGPINSIYEQKNYNGGGVVSDESMKDARVVTVRVFHDVEYPSALYLPIGRAESTAEEVEMVSRAETRQNRVGQSE